MRSSAADRLKAAALDLFDTRGYDRTTVAALCAAADVSNGSFFHVFSTKEALAGALYLECLGAYQSWVLEALQDGAGASEGIAAFLHAHVVWVKTQRPQASFLFGHARSDWLSGIRESQRRLNQDFIASVGQWRATQVDAGRLVPISDQALVAQLIGPVQIACRAWLADPSAVSPDANVDELVALAWRGLCL